MKPLTAEEIADVRITLNNLHWTEGDLEDLRQQLPRLLDEVERSRGTDHPESEPANYGATALDTLNAAPFTPGGRFLFPRAYNQIHAELERSRALLKRIEWGGLNSGACPECGAPSADHYVAGQRAPELNQHAPDCELAALIAP